MPAFNHPHLFLYLFLSLLILGSGQSPEHPKKISPARKSTVAPKPKVVNPGLPKELFDKLSSGFSGLQMAIRVRRRWSNGQTLLPFKATAHDVYDSRFKVSLDHGQPISPVERWTLYLGPALTYDILIPALFAIVPVSKDPKDKEHPRQWDPVGLGTIRFSSVQEKINMFKVLHDHLPYLASISHENNSLFLDNIIRFIEALSDDKEKKLILEMNVNQILWFGMLKAMEEACGTGSGFPLSELECHHAGATVIDRF
ncbi:hypothetical protein F5878DRAFT_662118 [Lentinula raphanica]|uniref:Uncharacterized protein n=1 Tax=Lentinula raphanica TaxID=153919 RepID=A0AA38UCT3_9AGAR|nr:hypothetical protein F5878DRAFT_662118 [Lentinula raphanica]